MTRVVGWALSLLCGVGRVIVVGVGRRLRPRLGVVSVRELVVLGTASQVPTRARSHNAYLLRWDGEGILFDPGEGAQRQLTLAGIAAADITRICVTHFHGDHALGLPGVVQRLSLEEVSEPRRGQRVAFVMDTRLCPAVSELADGVDLLVIESTFLSPESGLAAESGHLTAAQAARVAADCGVRTLVLTHFSRRYDDPDAFHAEASATYDGNLIIASDLIRVPVPPR